MTLATVLTVILSIIGIISAIVGAGVFARNLNTRQTITTLKESLDIHKEALQTKDIKVGELSARIIAIAKELEQLRDQYNQIVQINLRLQKENLYWRIKINGITKQDGLPDVPAYIDDSEVDTLLGTIQLPPPVPVNTNVRRTPRN